MIRVHHYDNLSTHYQRKETIWLWKPDQPTSWHFVRVPQDISAQIRNHCVADGIKPRGWGAIRVDVRIGRCNWQTSIFPDRATSSFLLPIKKEIRTKLSLEAGDEVLLVCTVIEGEEG